MFKLPSLFCLKTLSRNISLGRYERNVCWPRPDYGPMEVQRSELLNGIRVAAVKPLGSQIGACTIMYQAGTRYEWDDHIGAVHFIRVGASTSGCGYSSFSKMRYLQQNGATITCSTDRQKISFTLRCPVTSYPELKHYLLDTAQRCCYNQWELDDRKQLIREDLTRVHPEQRVIDLVQRAAFIGPLSNSVFCEEERIDGMTENMVNCFAKTHFRSDACSIASIGVPFEETLKLAEKIEYKREKPPPRWEYMACHRSGFELYDLGPGSDTWIAVAVPGCGTCDINSLLKHAIVAAACGTGNMQVGQHSLDRTPQPPLGTMAGEDVHTEYKAFNISYKETGLFGIVAKTRASTAFKVALSAAEFLANVGDLDVNQIQVGKRRLKLSMAINDDNCINVTEGMALQLANNIQMDSAKSALCMIELLSPDEISCTAKELSSKRGCMSVAVVGDIGAVPHDRELICQ
ncbi:cytochrome b-c1 complex subunit 2, mitochondrial-like [Achroia grisella]|uniref:cytochrome b-c1 complex subunit 2, mitochondrial-like n=1 Tax=Achroia grisella TaxID=688607 RepID=UPI0027D28CF4|nr:cytochrome b-c1 complex subunit 2, mitochondrial-like [Achroia grisella]